MTLRSNQALNKKKDHTSIEIIQYLLVYTTAKKEGRIMGGVLQKPSNMVTQHSRPIAGEM
jgi:hypothetical protein